MDETMILNGQSILCILGRPYAHGNTQTASRRSCSVFADSLLTDYVLQTLSPKQKLNADTDGYGSGVGF